MPEEETKEEPKTEEEKEEENGGNPDPAAPTTLDKYQAENNRRAELLKQETELQERKEKLHTEQMLGGHSNAGQAPEAKKELTDEEYTEKVIAGETPEK